MRKAERKQFAFERGFGRRLLSPNAEPTFAIEDLALLQSTFGGCHNVGAKSGRRASRLFA